MNFCQKSSHHASQLHDCHNIRHHIDRTLEKQQPKQRGKKPAQSNAQSKGQLRKIEEAPQEGREVTFGSKQQKYIDVKCKYCPRWAGQLEAKEDELNRLKRQNMESEGRCTKLAEENRQLHGIVEYYRLEMDRIVKCGEEDIRNEIKRHMRENMELSGRNKYLLAKLAEIEGSLDKISQQNEGLHKKLGSITKERDEIAVNYEGLLSKFRNTSHLEKNHAQNLSAEQKKSLKNQEKYQIIIEQTKKSLQKAIKQNKKLQSENKDLSSGLKILQNKLKNQQRLQNLEQESYLQRESVYKSKINILMKQCEQLKSNLNKIELDGKLKDDQLSYCKKLIEKQIKILSDNKIAYEQASKHQPNPETERQSAALRDYPDHQNTSKWSYRPDGENRNNEELVSELRKEIKDLKQRLESSSKGQHNSQTVEQYILTIGASEAFRRIIDEKNSYIKKLIRQKGDLLQKP